MDINGKKKAKVSVGAMLSVMELVIAIGVFAIISTFLLRFFTVANRLSDEAREVSKASIKVEAVFEHIKAVGLSETASEFHYTESKDTAEAMLDEKLEAVSDTDAKAVYRILIDRVSEKDAAGALFSYNIKIIKIKNDAVLFDFNGKSYEKAVE